MQIEGKYSLLCACNISRNVQSHIKTVFKLNCRLSAIIFVIPHLFATCRTNIFTFDVDARKNTVGTTRFEILRTK